MRCHCFALPKKILNKWKPLCITKCICTWVLKSTRWFRHWFYNLYCKCKNAGKQNIKLAKLVIADTKLCLSFFYHMYGDSIGELQVILNTSGSNQIIFNKSNHQGNKWHYKELYFQPANDFQVCFFFFIWIGQITFPDKIKFSFCQIGNLTFILAKNNY